MAGIEDSLDEYICANAGEPGINMLVNAVQSRTDDQAPGRVAVAPANRGYHLALTTQPQDMRGPS
ncbi:hypothetical protein PPS11_37460 [Pseudomonas putida S11]|nr:hypothetical protein PPS11_37460 [Pseudomonas putida S11]